MSDAIAFTPALPNAYTDAFAALPMGNLEEIALAFSTNVFPPEIPLPTTVFQFNQSGTTPVALAPCWQRDYAVQGRIFFAGEACSVGVHSTVRGAYETGFQAAIDLLAALGH